MQFFITDALAADQQPAPADAGSSDTSTAAADQPYDLTPQKMMQDNLLILGLLFFIFYFILIRPQQKRLKMQKEMMKGLKKGDRILSSAGIYGTIVKFEGDDIVVVEIAPNVRVRKSRVAIAEVLNDKTAPGESANDN